MSVQFNAKRLLSGAFSGALAAPLFAVATAGAAIPVDEELVVTATRSPYSADHVASTVRVIDAEQIRASGAHNLSDLLRNLGPVQVQDSMGTGRDSRLALRGFATAQNVLVLVDGRSLNNTDLAGPDLTAVAVGDIERVEILEGGAGTLYGDQAVGGVINVITRSGGPRQGRVSVGHGSYDSENYAGSYQDRFASGLYYRVGSEVERSDAYRDGGAVAYGNYSGRVGWRHADGELFVEARASDDNYRLAGALSAAQVAQDRRQAGSSFNDYNANNRTARIGIDQRLGEYLELFASYGDRNEDVVINSMSSFGAAVTGQQRQVRTLDPHVVFTADGLRGTLGMDVERVDYDFALDFGFGPSGTEQRQRKRSEYLHFIYTPIERLDLQGGLRHARLDAEVAPFGVNYDQSTLVHTVGLNWRGDRGRYYLNRDETFRFALADENIDFMGNFNPLKVQRGVAWELGSEWSWAMLDLHAALFQQDLKHEIGFDPGLGDFGANANFDDTRRRGGTLDARYHATDALVFGGIYTYVDARFVAGRYDNNRVPDVARQLLKLNANYRFDPNFGLFGELVYTGPRNLDLGNNAEVGGYTLANLTATWTRQSWTLQARLNNITDKQYTEFASFFGTRALYPSPERNLMLTLSRDF